MAEKHITLTLRTGECRWAAGFDRTTKRLYIAGIAETEVSNILWEKWWTFGFNWPWVRYITCFVEV